MVTFFLSRCQEDIRAALLIRASVWDNKKINECRLFPAERIAQSDRRVCALLPWYNIEGAKNLLGFEKMMELMARA